FFCFFFQAEDGIRDTSVTGVQTCALPIFAIEGDVRLGGKDWDDRIVGHVSEIGRASCRESVDLGGRRIIKKKKKEKQQTSDTQTTKPPSTKLHTTKNKKNL